MKRVLTIAMVVGLSALFFSGCAWQRTEQQVDEAKTAIEQARSAGAAQKCPNEFNEVLNMWQEAESLSPCSTQKARTKAAAVKERAQQLCTDSDGDGVVDQQDLCPNTPTGYTVNQDGCAMDSDGDGIMDPLDECPDTPAGVNVGKNGCAQDSDGDRVPDDFDRCPDTPQGAAVDDQGCWLIGNVYFDLDESRIKPQFRDLLDEVAEVMQQNPEISMSIQGHTDSIASDAYNMQLSENRAEQVKLYLMKKGVEADRLTTKAFGEDDPKRSNIDPEARAMNRRVELHPNW
jgi:OOP family OmpA-OmpF porin